MVFCETKRDADALTVSSDIKQETHVLHGDIPQDKRELVLQVKFETKYFIMDPFHLWTFAALSYSQIFNVAKP